MTITVNHQIQNEWRITGSGQWKETLPELTTVSALPVCVSPLLTTSGTLLCVALCPQDPSVASLGDVPTLNEKKGLSQKFLLSHFLGILLTSLDIVCGIPPKVQQFSSRWSSEQNLAWVPEARQAYSTWYFHDLAEVWGKFLYLQTYD